MVGPGGWYLVGLVGLEDEGVNVAELVRLARDGLLDEVVLAVVVEDNVHLRTAAGGVGSTLEREWLMALKGEDMAGANKNEGTVGVHSCCRSSAMIRAGVPPSRTFLLEEPQMSGPNMML